MGENSGNSRRKANRIDVPEEVGKEGGEDFNSFVMEFVRSVILAVPVRIFFFCFTFFTWVSHRLMSAWLLCHLFSFFSFRTFKERKIDNWHSYVPEWSPHANVENNNEVSRRNVKLSLKPLEI